MSTLEDLRRNLDEEKALTEKFREEFRRELERREARQAVLEETIAKLERLSTRQTLTEAVTPVNSRSNTMNESQRVAISRAKRRKGDRISAAINKSDLSKNDLAKRLGVTAAAISRWISGDRRIPKTRAEEIQAATKGRVQVSDWPNLATDDA